MKNRMMNHYLDGFVNVYRPNDNRSNFGAKKNIKNIADMELVYKLAYQQSSKRLQDIEFAESSGRDLSLKIKTRLVDGINNSDKVVLNDVLYDIIYVDEDRFNRELYLYLEEAGPIE